MGESHKPEETPGAQDGRTYRPRERKEKPLAPERRKNTNKSNRGHAPLEHLLEADGHGHIHTGNPLTLSRKSDYSGSLI